MKINKIILMLSLLLVALLAVGCASASEDNNGTDESSVLEMNYGSVYNFNENTLSVSEGSALSDSKIIEVDNFGENHNEMNERTIRDAISGANDGDTILIRGDEYVHCHIVVDKPLVIRSDIGTKLSHCGNQGLADSGHQGIFYLTSNANGTVIEGFNFLGDNLYDDEGYGILVRGASDVIIRNCNMSNDNVGDAIRLENSANVQIYNVNIANAVNGIKIKGSECISVNDSSITNSNYGIYDVDSTKTTINSNTISNNRNAGIAFVGSSNNPTVSFNDIIENRNGIEMTSSDNINILSNYIASSTNFGVLVDCNLTQINIIGNFFYRSASGEIYFTKKIFYEGWEKYEVVNNNYMVGNGQERPVDALVGGGAFLGYTFEIDEYIACPKIYFTYGPAHWYEGNYWLKLSEISQLRKGEYSISIVDDEGNVATGLSSVPVTFYLNKDNNYVDPQEGDVYKTVMMVDGTATVRFYNSDFKESGNVITAVTPGNSKKLTGDGGKNVKTFTVDDADIPMNLTQSKIVLSDLTTNENSNADFTVSLTDINNNPIANAEVIFNIASKEIPATTADNGQATIKINENAGTYSVVVSYGGGDDYEPATANATVTVNQNGNQETNTQNSDSAPTVMATGKVSTKIAASNYAMFIKKVDYYKLTLRDSSNNPLASQKVTIKVNKKTYNVKTNSKGVAKVKLKLKKGTYNVRMTYNGNSKYAAAKSTKKIKVKKVLKTKITAPKVTVALKASTKYVVTLKDENGKAIKKQKVTVKVNGKKYTKKTNAKGQATVKVKFSKIKSYKVNVNYKGSKLYKKSSASGKITVKASTTSSTAQQDANPVEQVVETKLITYNRSFSMNSTEGYLIVLKDSAGNALANQPVTYDLADKSYSQNTDDNGQVKVDISSLSPGSYVINANHAKTDNYGASASSGTITILNKTGITFVDGGLPNDAIQRILDVTANPVEFLADSYDDVSLKISRALDITFKENTTLNGRANSPVLTISASNVNISNLIINADEGLGIVVENADNVIVSNNVISNTLDSSKKSQYDSGEMTLPGDGISISNASNVNITKNDVKSFGNAIFAENSENVEIIDNTLSLSNYGITYGAGVKNTNISENLITKNIGLYVMDVPEGPLGYGIFLNQSAVNVSIVNNRILDNYMGISVDANHSTGIVILYNWISDNALEGIRFNAGYDLAENAVEPNVNDNAIYRNAKGPSMMILGELSANPNGIYQYGEFDDTEKLQLGANWFGKNARLTWDYATNKTGYGTMCPRINATYISVKEIEVVSPGTYQVKFYKNNAVASKLPVFEMYATLNDNNEVIFDVVNGVGTFSFDSGFRNDDNQIKVSIGSLDDDYRNFEAILNITLDASEIPV